MGVIMTNKFKKEYSHYYKKIPDGVEYIDVYRVLELFNVVDPALQHAVKKLLVAGDRGHKDLIKDVREAVVSLERWIEMREEELQADKPLIMKTDDSTNAVNWTVAELKTWYT